MSSAPRAKQGFTLVELLVALAILAILVSAVVSLTGSFLGYSRHVNATNAGLSDLNDAAGYVVTNVRRAARVVGQPGTSSVTIQTASASYTCVAPDAASWDPSAWPPTSTPLPCVALVVPVVDEGTADITGYDLLAYQVAPISDWTSNPGFPEGWDGPNTPIMLEYHANLCDTDSTTAVPDCPAADPGPGVPDINGSTVTADSVSLVLANLTLGSNAPFEIVGAAGSVKDVTVAMQLRGSGVEASSMIPSDGPLILTAIPRPKLGIQ